MGVPVLPTLSKSLNCRKQTRPDCGVSGCVHCMLHLIGIKKKKSLNATISLLVLFKWNFYAFDCGVKKKKRNLFAVTVVQSVLNIWRRQLMSVFAVGYLWETEFKQLIFCALTSFPFIVSLFRQTRITDLDIKHLFRNRGRYSDLVANAPDSRSEDSHSGNFFSHRPALEST